MCHLPASKHQLTRSWGGSVSIPACPVLRNTAEDKAGSDTRRGVTCQPSNTLNCPQESLLLYLRSTHSSCLGAACFLHPCAVQLSISDAFTVPQKTAGLGQGRRRREEGWHLARAAFAVCHSAVVVSVPGSQQPALAFPCARWSCWAPRSARGAQRVLGRHVARINLPAKRFLSNSGAPSKINCEACLYLPRLY